MYDYNEDVRSASIASDVQALADQYHRDLPSISDDELIELLAIPMWVEAKKILAEKVVATPSEIETAMSGGLGFKPRGQWNALFQSLGDAKIEHAIQRWSSVFKSMSVS